MHPAWVCQSSRDCARVTDNPESAGINRRSLVAALPLLVRMRPKQESLRAEVRQFALFPVRPEILDRV